MIENLILQTHQQTVSVKKNLSLKEIMCSKNNVTDSSKLIKYISLKNFLFHIQIKIYEKTKIIIKLHLTTNK